MAWKDKLQPASFRGVPFEVEGDDGTFGRRVQVHEYPQRDKPFAEDLGRETREFQITGFLIGPDYLAARDRLLAALEEPGAGTLVHPWYGSMQVVAKPARVSHSTRDGGMCALQLVFVEAGELTFPTTSVSTSARSRLAADAGFEAVGQDFIRQWGVVGWPEWVREDAIAVADTVLAGVEVALRVLGGGLGVTAAGVRRALGLIVGEAPLTVAARLLSIFDGARGLESGVSRESTVRGLLRTALAVPSQPAASISAAPARQQSAANGLALAALVRQGALLAAVDVASASTWPVLDDAAAVRDSLTAALDREGYAAGDDLFAALQGARTAAYQDITARSRGAARLRTVAPLSLTPAVVLAYDIYDDALRGDEIVTRNKVAHPGFLPAVPLEVLSQ